MKAYLLFIGILVLGFASCQNTNKKKYNLTIYKKTKYESSVKMSEIELIAENDSIAFGLSYSEFCEQVSAFHYIYTLNKKTTSVPYKFILLDNNGKTISNGSLIRFNTEDDIMCNPKNIKKMIKEMQNII